MSWVDIAKKDIEDSLRSKSLWIVTLIFILLIAGGTFAMTLLPEDSGLIGETLSSNNAIIALSGISSLLVPLIALMIGYMSVAGERDSGTIKILYSLPNSRFDIVLGKWIGRSVVAVTPILIAFTVSALIILGLYDQFNVDNFLIFLITTILLAISFLSIAIGFSSASKTKSKAMAWAIATFFLFAFIWDLIPLGFYYLLEGGLPGGSVAPTWYVLLQRITPIGAFNTLSSGLMDLSGSLQSPSISQLIGQETVPFYLTNYAFTIIIILWIVIPVIIGYLIFKKSEID